MTEKELIEKLIAGIREVRELITYTCSVEIRPGYLADWDETSTGWLGNFFEAEEAIQEYEKENKRK